MTRANIIVNDDPDFLTLLPADPQPLLDCFTVLLTPRWWALASLRPFLLVSPLRDSIPFIAVSFPDQPADDFMPQVHCRLVSAVAFAPPTSVREAVHLTPDDPIPASLVEASLICVHDPSHDVRAFLPAQRHLESLVHAPQRPEPDSHPTQTALLAVFLGFDFDHFCVQLNFGSVDAQVATATCVAKEDIFLVRQRNMFDRHVVAGRRPSYCFGFRNVRDMHGPLVGSGLFIDCRPLGRPICFRAVNVPSLTPGMLCLWLGVPAPDGFEPRCQGGAPFDSVDSAVDAFTIEHGDSVTLWMNMISPPGSPNSPGSNSDDDVDPHADEGGHDAGEPGAGDDGIS